MSRILSGYLTIKQKRWLFTIQKAPLPIKALPYLIEAAEHAFHRCANETAVQHYRQALALVKEQPDCDIQQLIRIESGLGQALKFVGEFSEACRTLENSLQHLLSLSIKFESPLLLPILIRSLLELSDIRVREGALETAIDHLQAGLDALGKQGAEENPYFWRSLMDRLGLGTFPAGES